MNKPNIQVGEYILYNHRKGVDPVTGGNYHAIIKKITEKRDTGYSWHYVDAPDKEFWSENSSDPFFVRTWEYIRLTEIKNNS